MTDHLQIFRDVNEELAGLDMVDVHTHLRWDVPQARSLGEIVFYHFVSFELLSAGLPPEVLQLEDEREKLRAALPYLPLIRTSGTSYCLRRLLQDLFGMKEDLLTEGNLDAMIAKVAETAADREWPREVLVKRGRIRKSFLNVLWYEDWARKAQQGEEGAVRYRDMFVPAIEDACFVASNAAGIVAQAGQRSGIEVKDSSSLAEAARHYATDLEFDAIKTWLGWASTDFLYRAPSPEAADVAISKALRGEPTNEAEDNAVRSFAFVALLDSLKKRGVPFQFFFGSDTSAGGGPAICAYRPDVFRRLTDLFHAQPDMEFDLFLGSILYSQEAAIQAKMYRNVHVAGIWWHCMYPSFIRRILTDRLDVCPLNKVTAFFSDSYTVEWGYGKRQLVQRELAALLAERVATGYLTRNDASEIAQRWLWQNPVEIYGLE